MPGGIGEYGLHLCEGFLHTSRGSLEAVREAVERIAASGAPIVAAGPGAASLGARHAIELPPAPDPLLSPLLSVLPGQLFAAALARAKRLDAGAPRNLRKVTLAR